MTRELVLLNYYSICEILTKLGIMWVKVIWEAARNSHIRPISKSRVSWISGEEQEILILAEYYDITTCSISNCKLALIKDPLENTSTS